MRKIKENEILEEAQIIEEVPIIEGVQEIDEIQGVVGVDIRTKALRKLIFLVAFTGLMLIMSTYAWFSTQKNVTLGGLQGKVNVAEGLQVSLDAKTWKNEIDFGQFTTNADGKKVSDTYLPGATLDAPYAGGINILPDEMLPVSTTGTTGEGIGGTKLPMYRGENTDAVKLTEIGQLAEVPESGYYAIDIFLQNISKDTVTFDKLKLAQNSSISLLQVGKEQTGLQNTVRVALALYDNSGDDKVKVSSTPSTAQILEGTANQNIIDVAIWEPNANAHVQQIVNSNNYIKWNTTDATAIFGEGATGSEKFGLTTQIPTYALTAASVTANEIAGAKAGSLADIYDWATLATGLVKQYTLQTTTDTLDEVKQLVSTTDGATEFQIAAGEYHKLRMYIWLEGQDVDCTNYASHGGGINVDFGITKGTSDDTVAGDDGWVYAGEIFDKDGSYETNPDKLHIGDFVNYNAGTWTAEEIQALNDAGNNVSGSAELPGEDFQFGGFIAGSSRDGNATPNPYEDSGITYANYLKDASTGEDLAGWRVFDIEDDGKVILISAGCPEDFYVPYEDGKNNGYASEYILSGNINSDWTTSDAEKGSYQVRSWNNYVNSTQKAESATLLTKSRLDSWYSKYIETGADVWNYEIFQMIYQEPYIKYQNMIENYSDNWLASAYYPHHVCIMSSGDRLVDDYRGVALGVRPLVSLSSNVKFTATKTGTKTVTGGNMDEFGGDQTYNVWGIQ